MTTSFINCGSERGDISLGIFDLVNGFAESVEKIGVYSHPDHSDQPDWDIAIYKITQNGYPCYAASTNGDPVWEEQDEEVWSEMLAEYGVTL